MDGTLAVIFAIAGLTEMGLSHCPTGCLAPTEVPSRLAFQLSEVEFQEQWIGEEVYAELAFPVARGPFQPVAAASWTTDDSIWIGLGLRTEVPFGTSGWLYEGALIPGLHDPGEGPDLGSNLQFRSSFGLSYAFENDLRVGVFYDHRSNADTDDLNPGLETYGLRVSVPLSR